MNLKEKTAIVTGASKGIGLAICHALLEKGVQVCGWSRSNTPIPNAKYHHIPCDVRNESEVIKAYEKSTKILSNNVNILINNAGLGFQSSFEALESSQWHQMFQTNVDSIFYCSKQVIPSMKANGFGHIINISSIAGLTGIATMGAYCATKHAVRGLSHAMYKELRKNSIKVTCVYPGSVNTHFFDDIEDITANNSMLNPKDVANTLIHILETPDNYLPVDIEIRPLNPKYS